MSPFPLVAPDWNFWPEGLDPATIWEASAALGFDGIELGVYQPEVELSAERMAGAAAAARRHGVGVSAVLFSMPPARWPEGGLASADHGPAAVRTIVETGRRAADLGARVLGVWPGCDLLPGPGGAWRRTVDGVAAIADGTAGLGLRVAIEAKPGQVVGTSEDAVRLCRETGRDVGVLLDTAHALAGAEDLAALPAAIGPVLVHVHLGDSDGADADADLPPGDAHHFGPFLAALDRTGYPGALAFDLYGSVGGGPGSGESALRRGLAHVRSAAPAARAETGPR